MNNFTKGTVIVLTALFLPFLALAQGAGGDGSWWTGSGENNMDSSGGWRGGQINNIANANATNNNRINIDNSNLVSSRNSGWWSGKGPNNMGSDGNWWDDNSGSWDSGNNGGNGDWWSDGSLPWENQSDSGWWNNGGNGGSGDSWNGNNWGNNSGWNPNWDDSNQNWDNGNWDSGNWSNNGFKHGMRKSFPMNRHNRMFGMIGGQKHGMFGLIGGRGGMMGRIW